MIVFDLDGTLCDTTAVDAELFLATAEETLGVSLRAPDGWESCPQVTDPGVLEWMWLRHRATRPSPSDVSDFVGRFASKLSDARVRDPTRFQATAGALSLLETLAGRGASFGIATGGWGSPARLKLGAAGIPLGLLAASADDSIDRAEIFRLGRERIAMRSMTASGSVVLVGDGVWDARVAHQLGWCFVGIASRQRAARLLEVGAAAVFEDFRDLLGFMSTIEACRAA